MKNHETDIFPWGYHTVRVSNWPMPYHLFCAVFQCSGLYLNKQQHAELLIHSWIAKQMKHEPVKKAFKIMKFDSKKPSWKKWGMSIHLQRSYGTLKTFACLHISSTIKLCLWKWKRLKAQSLSFDMWRVCETALNYNSSCREPANLSLMYVCGGGGRLRPSARFLCKTVSVCMDGAQHITVQENYSCEHTGTLVLTHTCMRSPFCWKKMSFWLAGGGGGVHNHERKTICGLMNADRKACWIGVDTAKLTRDQCHFVEHTTQTHPKTSVA